MEESDFEIVRTPAAVSRIFEQMLERRKPLSIIQHGHRSDAWVVRVFPDRLLLAKRDKASYFTAEELEFQFRCVIGRNITGRTRVARLNDEYLEIVLPSQLVVVQRRHAYRVVPTADSSACFLAGGKWVISGRIEDISARGILVRVPQAAPVTVPGLLANLRLHLNHALSPAELAGRGSKAPLEMVQVTIPEATVVRKADKGITKFAAYGVHFIPNIILERQLVQIILRFERAARQKGIVG